MKTLPKRLISKSPMLSETILLETLWTDQNKRNVQRILHRNDALIVD